MISPTPSGLAGPVRVGRLRRLVGIVRANRPWRLTVRLYRLLALPCRQRLWPRHLGHLHISANPHALRLTAVW